MQSLTSPAPGEPLRLLQISDCHLFADPDATMHGGITRRSLMRVLAAAREDLAACHAVLATGDLSQDESQSAYQDFVQLLEPFDRPVLCIPGNHDNPQLMRTHLDRGGFQFCGAAKTDDWLLIMLSSQIKGRTNGALSQQERDRLQQLLDRHPEHHALVCLHHQPVNVGSAWLDAIGLEDAPGFMQQVQQAGNVRAVIWGHIHQEFQSRNAGMDLLAAPSTCHQFVPGRDDFTMDKGRSGYRLLALHPDGRIETRVCWVST